jgi:hypothetical protein
MKRTGGSYNDDWPNWYADYIVREQAGKPLPILSQPAWPQEKSLELHCLRLAAVQRRIFAAEDAALAARLACQCGEVAAFQTQPLTTGPPTRPIGCISCVHIAGV